MRVTMTTTYYNDGWKPDTGLKLMTMMTTITVLSVTIDVDIQPAFNAMYTCKSGDDDDDNDDQQAIVVITIKKNNTKSSLRRRKWWPTCEWDDFDHEDDDNDFSNTHDTISARFVAGYVDDPRNPRENRPHETEAHNK